MNVLIVCNNAYMPGNGLCTAVRTLKEQLREAGIEARVMASPNPVEGGQQPDYCLGHFRFPMFESLIYASGFRYAKADVKMMREAIGWADVVHIEEGFPIEAKATKIARRMGKPCVGSFHLLSENIMANLGLRRDRLINGIITWFWRKTAYDRCRIIHCPTEMIRAHLKAHGFKSELQVFSNGIWIPDEPITAPAPGTSPYVISSIGRFANEKSQKTLLEAMRLSRHASEIQLEFAGKGPKEKKCRRLARKLYEEGVLKYEPHFGFYDEKGLRSLASRAYLNVHCAWVEVEGLSCIEALREGTVPLIAEGRMTATKVFALDERSIFPERDSKALAEKIDWWIEHPEERLAMGQKYADYARTFDRDASVKSMMEMYKKAIAG